MKNRKVTLVIHIPASEIGTDILNEYTVVTLLRRLRKQLLHPPGVPPSGRDRIQTSAQNRSRDRSAPAEDPIKRSSADSIIIQKPTEGLTARRPSCIMDPNQSYLFKTHSEQLSPLHFSITISDSEADTDRSQLSHSGPDRFKRKGYMYRSPIHQRACIDMEETGKNLKKHIAANQITMMELKTMLGLKRAESIYHWLEGKSLPTIENLYRLHHLFHCHMEDLLVSDVTKLRTVNTQGASLKSGMAGRVNENG